MFSDGREQFVVGIKKQVWALGQTGYYRRKFGEVLKLFSIGGEETARLVNCGVLASHFCKSTGGRLQTPDLSHSLVAIGAGVRRLAI
jgi:hypothetical protein